MIDFLAIYVLIYTASLAIYFATGSVMARINSHHPERRIQSERSGGTSQADEIRYSIKALAMSALLLSGGYFAQTRGWTPTPYELTPLTFVIGFVVAMFILDAWFYFGHRLLHHPLCYRFHALHHRSIAPSAWSNDSSTLVDTLIEHGFYLAVWFVLPIPAAAVFALRLWDQVSGMVGHSGFEYFASASSRWPSPMVCTTFHDLHHSRFKYNYGNMFSLWDRLLGTIHPDYDEMVGRMAQGEAPGLATRRS